MYLIWGAFILLIIGMLALDLGVFNKTNHTVSVKESLIWTAVWITISLLFSIPIYYIYKADVQHIDIDNLHEKEAVINYLTGYVIEKSLSLDNIFVIALIFGYFKIPLKFQHKILFWGILGAIVFRGVMIILGASLIHRFHFIMYAFGVLLLWSAWKMLKSEPEKTDFNDSSGVKLLSKIFPISWKLHDGKFFTRIDGKKYATVLLAALVVIEFTDVLFAVDSIPAIFAVTTDPFIVFSSNIFAILGLRSLYFFLANILDMFKYLKYSLIFILSYVGVKMLIVDFYHIPAMASLIVILVSLGLGIIVSLRSAK